MQRCAAKNVNNRVRIPTNNKSWRKIMALTVNSNVASLNGQHNLLRSQGSLNTSMHRLSSGLRINSAKDDAAGLAISDRMTAQIKGMNQAARNANDGISLAQTAEGAMQETTNILQRMRELSVQAANDTNTSDDRKSISTEMTQLKEELNRIASATEFNGQKLINGGAGEHVFQVGANKGDTITVSLQNDKFNMTTGSAGLNIAGIDVNTQSGASDAIESLDNALKHVDTARSELGAVQNRFESTISNLQNSAENITAARSRILDTDIAAESSALAKSRVLQQAGVSMLAQANQAPQTALSLIG